MKFASAISKKEKPYEALEEISEAVHSQLAGKKIDLSFVFISPRYDLDWFSFSKEIHKILGEPVLLGCSSEGVIGQDLEIEFQSAIALMAAHLPDVQIKPFQIDPQDVALSSEKAYWLEKTKTHPLDQPVFILIPDPYTCDAMKLINEFEKAFPNSPIVGGLASGVPPLKENCLLLNDRVFQQGAVGVSLTGNIELKTIVSQGCRPIGNPLKITKAKGNVIQELGGKTATQILNELFLSLSHEERILAQHSLFLGLAVDPHRPYYERGDFLIRNIIAFDAEIGALAIGENNLAIGQTVQFQLRDAVTAEEDLRTLLEIHQLTPRKKNIEGGLLFSCLGRGAGLFGKPHHDIRLIKEITGEYPVGGFFCNGEIGPISGKNFIHGYTSSIGLFMPKDLL